MLGKGRRDREKDVEMNFMISYSFMMIIFVEGWYIDGCGIWYLLHILVGISTVVFPHFFRHGNGDTLSAHLVHLSMLAFFSYCGYI